jgi:hypothetical protein
VGLEVFVTGLMPSWIAGHPRRTTGEGTGCAFVTARAGWVV